ncbi:Glycerophosphoryl diester phosphodiesterase family protein [Spironucleus salmonicida]|uniref:Glycerophosphoryl diester phosphodiesterase family protein n=1 Tax=Spironucleus salmonicida TaxID=348837 RepID=A0A9P8S2F8_9EUKA|nr:Glycerophosphoryl diester phosphodiesterase family protein [Spironucleus salmonicida]
MTIQPTYEESACMLCFKFRGNILLTSVTQVFKPSSTYQIFDYQYAVYEDLKYGSYQVQYQNKDISIDVENLVYGIDFTSDKLNEYKYSIGDDVVIIEGNSTQEGPFLPCKHDIYLQFNNILPPQKLVSGYMKLYPNQNIIQLLSGTSQLISTLNHIKQSYQQDYIFHYNNEQIAIQAFWWCHGKIIPNQHTSCVKSVEINPSDREYKSQATSSTLQTYLKIGHRGCGMNKAFASGRVKIAENTVESFNKAYEFGMDMIETDVIITKDKIPIINHDFKVQYHGLNLAIIHLLWNSLKKQKLTNLISIYFKIP